MVGEPFGHSSFGSAERGTREPYCKNCYLRFGRHIFHGGRGFYERGQADLKLDRQALVLEETADLDQIATTLPFARIVFGSCDHLGTGETCSSLFGGDGSDRHQRPYLDGRRIIEARARRALIQSHTRQIDEDSSICLVIR